MATEVTIGGDGTLFVGEDKTFRLELLDVAGVPVNMAGMTIKFILRLTDSGADPAIFDKTATVGGVYNVVRASNTQRATVVFTDVELDALTAKTYRHSWKRMDADYETILAFGPFIVQKATAR